jgi:hypothetical protein
MNRIFSFSFSDDPPWPAEADGDGYSLVSQMGDPTGDPDLASYWRRSANAGGSPFANDPVSTDAGKVLFREWGELTVYPNPSSGVVVVSLGIETEGPVTVRFISVTGVTALVRETEGTEVIDLAGAGLAPGVYTVAAEHRGVSYRTRLVYLPDR